MDVFSRRLKEYRERLKNRDKKWTQKYVADKVNVARVTYTAYENGTKSPPLETVNKIAELFGVSTDYLMGRTDNPTPIGRNKDDDEVRKQAIIAKIIKEFPDADLMFKDLANMSADQLEEVYDFIKFKKSQKD